MATAKELQPLSLGALASNPRRSRTMDERTDISQLSTRLAMARLRHQVGQLQSQVEQDRKLVQPTRKVYHCVVDDTALTAAIPEIKRWIADGAVVMTVPLVTLDGLDQFKKGTDIVNVNSRESIRYFDRIQNGSLSVRGIHFQKPAEMFENWKDCEEFLVPDAKLPSQQKSPRMRPMTPVSPTNQKPGELSFSPPRGGRNGTRNGYQKGRSNTFPMQQNGQPQQQNQRSRFHDMPSPLPSPQSSPYVPLDPPRKIQQLLNCALYRKHKFGKRDAPPPGHTQLAKRPEIHIVTNNPEVAAWARVYDVSVMSSNQLEDMVEREDFIFEGKMKEYEEAQVEARKAQQPSRGGRHGGRGGRNGRNGGGGGGRGGGRGGHMEEPDFVFVREAPRGVARGKGKLWEP